MSINSEKIIIYQLMQEIVKERRELSKQYFDLKTKLDQLNSKNSIILDQTVDNLTIMEKEKIRQQDYFFNKNRNGHHNTFDRVKKNIVSILKDSPIPLSNKQIFEKLNEEYELSISLENLSCNILPKMKNERSLRVQKICRGYWQYERKKGATDSD